MLLNSDRRSFRFVLPVICVVLITCFAQCGSAEEPDHESAPLAAGSGLRSIFFPDQIPSSSFFDFPVGAGGRDLEIFARDCCVRDDVVEIYVDNCLVATVDSRSGPRGTHQGETHIVSLGEGIHTIEYRMVVSGDGGSQWFVSEIPTPFTGDFPCGCTPADGMIRTETISGIGKCPQGPAFGPRLPVWGSFGRKQILMSDRGDKLAIGCFLSNSGQSFDFRMQYQGPASSKVVRVGVCPFAGGCNQVTFTHTGDADGDDMPDCILKTRWVSRDYNNNDDPNPWTGQIGDTSLDWAISDFNAVTGNLDKISEQYEYKVGPPVACPSSKKAEGKLLKRIVIDPPIGPETEAFFDEVLGRLQLQPPDQPMGLQIFRPCDVDRDDDCDRADFELFESLLGTCLSDERFEILADVNLDGCVDEADRNQLFSILVDVKPNDSRNTVNPKSKGVIPVAVLTTDFSLDARDLDTLFVTFGISGKEASPVHDALEDVDGDGDLDLILHFRTRETGIICGDDLVYLRALTLDGTEVRTFEPIRTVGCK